MVLKNTLIAGLILAGFASSANATELRAFRYSYDHGTVARSTSQDDQHVICDSCPRIPDLEKYIKEIGLLAANISLDAEDDEDNGFIPKLAQAKLGTTHKIHFKFGSSKVSAAEKNLLGSFLKKVVKNGKNEIVVTGYTCDIGSKNYNLLLSKRRAKAIGRQLNLLGYDRVTVTGKGILPTGPDGRKENRRGDVLIKDF